MQATAPKIVLFDWDLTLIEHQKVMITAKNKLLSEISHMVVDHEAIDKYKNYSLNESFLKIFGDNHKHAKTLFHAYFLEDHLEQLNPLPNVDSTLLYLKHNSIPTAIVSNKTSSVLKAEVSHLDWNNHFYNVLGSGDYPEDKPSKAPIEVALTNYPEIKKSEVWFVGDSHVDIECANAYGCVSVLINPKPSNNLEKSAKFHVDDHIGLINLMKYGVLKDS